ncbi:2-nitropropane dioxygenase [Fusarium redolens]|uniref:2-nitropropane dioxygenase n=1 Tax=Fusarium redolens TaxID=48865 RepID=A0A9P9HDU0_FUSRE|nr:2-nitropropane dioxygenase [Fusarium redolens]KAH7255814.1 2-nitropropane dioxygenase [Fusarium redolens]
MSSSQLLNRFPWVKSPLISNAPMLGIATPLMAAEVTKAGGFGFLPSLAYIEPSSEHINRLVDHFDEVRALLGADQPSDGPLRVGASFITSHSSLSYFEETALPLIVKNRPAAIWLFAPDGDLRPHSKIIPGLKALEYPPVVFVQVGNVAAAREAVQDGADVLVTQGVDAGGHQFRQGSGIVSLVPEVRNMLDREFPDRAISIVAAGGIADGRGVAGALALGAEGVVMGTKTNLQFTIAPESNYPKIQKQKVLEAVDGGVSTFKSTFNDRIVNSPLWGPLYDGRAIVGPIHEKFFAGASLEECQRSLKEDYSEEEARYVVNTWAGTGVGLINKVQPAGEIVREVREQARRELQRAAGLV